MTPGTASFVVVGTWLEFTCTTLPRDVKATPRFGNMAGSWLVPTTEAVKDVVGADAFRVYPPDGAHRAVSEPLRVPFPSRSRKYHEPSEEKISEVDRFWLIAVKRVFCNWPSISLATVDQFKRPGSIGHGGNNHGDSRCSD